MKFSFVSVKILVVFALFIGNSYNSVGQTAITAVTIQNVNATSGKTYTSVPAAGGTAGLSSTYTWGTSTAATNNIKFATGFNIGATSYTYDEAFPTFVRFRRVNNNNGGTPIIGKRTMIFAERSTVFGTSTQFNLLPGYEDDMEKIFDNRTANIGTDNLFINDPTQNSNNIERVDVIYTGGISSTATPANIGFAVFDRGNTGAHDAVVVAAILSIDGNGLPTSFSAPLRIATANFGHIATTIDYHVIRKEEAATNLAISISADQSQQYGGAYVSFQNLGVAANTTIYGYAIIANDLPVAATAANLIDFTNATYYPTNTNNGGGIDLLAITGIARTGCATLPANVTPAPVCFGTSLSITGSGSTANSGTYTFWDDIRRGTKYTNGTNGYTISNTTFATPTNLAAGTYTVFVQAEGTICASPRRPVTFTINPASAYKASTSAATCNGVTANNNGTITLTGFAATDKFAFNAGNTYTGTATFATATTVPVNGVIANNLANPATATQNYAI